MQVSKVGCVHCTQKQINTNIDWLL